MTDAIAIHNINCIDYIRSKEYQQILENEKICIVTDPPFNINYHYGSYTDRLKETEYYSMLKELHSASNGGFVCIHYPEQLHRLSIEFGKAPEKVVSWVYNSNTAKQHRDIAYWDVKPDFRKVRQPYKNPNDKRIRERIERGITGGRLYDWWNINQIKNVSKKKYSVQHPCLMPTEVMTNTIGILPEDAIIFDPFTGGGGLLQLPVNC